MAEYETFPVKGAQRQPLVDYMIKSLKDAGCTIINCSDASRAPFRISFETAMAERMGVVAYAFTANQRLTTNRPDDEHRFQVKYGPKTGRLHEIWGDPFGLYTTIFVGINVEEGFFVGVDPEMHNPTRFFISVEFKERDAQEIIRKGWHAWERQKRIRGLDEPIEVLVGGVSANFLRYIQFERAARGLDQGHRQLLAEKPELLARAASPALSSALDECEEAMVHPLADELKLSAAQILDLIGDARRLKMAVRGWVAEEHLRTTLAATDGVTDCVRLDEEGGPDLRLRFQGGPPLTIECKNVLRKRSSEGLAKVDFQRTRAAKSDPCSRYYSAGDFDLLAACLHAVTEQWEFRYVIPGALPSHTRCPGKINNNVVVGSSWPSDPSDVLAEVNRRMVAL